MKFEKIGNGALRCTLTQEDLARNGVGLDDFFTNTPNARNFLEKLIHIAEEEVGFRTTGNMMSIQAAIMSEDEIVLTFTESQVNGAEIIEHLRNMLSNRQGLIQQENEEELDVLKELSQGETKPNDSSRDAEGYVYLVNFVSFARVRDFCKVLPKPEKTRSRLYYLDKKEQYFLWADLNQSSRQYIYEFVASSMEYADSIEKDSSRSSYLEEHAKIIVRNHALETLAQL